MICFWSIVLQNNAYYQALNEIQNKLSGSESYVMMYTKPHVLLWECFQMPHFKKEENLELQTNEKRACLSTA